MKGSGADAPADRAAHDDGDTRAPTVMSLREIVDDLIEATGDEVRELHLDHGDEAVEREPERRSQRAGLDDRRVADTRSAELLEESLRHLEDPAVLGNVL